MEVWKDQAHATKVAQEMAVKERNRFGRTAATLERKALKLGEDVRRLMKSGKEMSAQELKDLRKLLRKTAKTAKSASHRDRPESPPAPPPPRCCRRRRHRRRPRRAFSRVSRHRLQSRRRARSRHRPQSLLRARNRYRRRHRRRAPSHVVNVLEDPQATAPVLCPAVIVMTAPGKIPWKVYCDIAGRHEWAKVKAFWL